MSIRPVRNINPYLINLITNNNRFFNNDKSSTMVINVLKFVNELKNIAIALKTGVAVEQDGSWLDHHKYITPNNPVVRNLAREITNFSDSDDTKMFKIEQWVQQNIEYISDVENYGMLEYWEYPIETLNKESADCEGQAFLTHSLGLAAGVNPQRLRTYGGLVFDPNSTSPGGHGWTSYMRETDNKWITIDTTYYAISDPISERTPQSENLKYIDDFWFIQAGKTIATPHANKVRYASQYAKGTLLNVII